MRARFLSVGAAMVGAAFLPQDGALAQGASDTVDEVVVTARKREESLQDIPVSITAFTRDDIERLDLRNLSNVADFTAGFEFKNQGNQQPGRYNTQLKFRGLTTSQFSPSFATGALFIDGIYVLNGGTSLSLPDVERVEVIKGPQAAYFGRNTFGGAVNLITRDPDLNSWGGDINVTTTSRENTDLNFFADGPIVSDHVSVSVSGRYYDKRGHYEASDGSQLGHEQTEAANLALLFEPTESLSFKLRYGISKDEDGAPAAAFISGILNDSCSTGGTFPNVTTLPRYYVCGQVPGPNQAVTDPGARLISQNTRLADILPQGDIDYLIDPPTNPDGLPSVGDVGLERETQRFSIHGSYEINGYTIDAIFGTNSQEANWIRDFDLTDRPTFFSSDPQDMEDDNYELRLTSPQDGPFRWLAGINYYEQSFISSGQGGSSVLTCLSVVPFITEDTSTCIPANFQFGNGLGDSDNAEVLGVFAAFDYDFGDHWTLSVEGRYQEEDFTKGPGVVDAQGQALQETFDDFLPRVILRWTPTDSTNVFASYSEGFIAGEFNTEYIDADDRERPQFEAAAPNISETLEPETLEAWEIGWKQNWMQGRLQTALSLYFYEWNNIKGRSSTLINETCDAGDIDSETGCSSADGIQVGDPKQVDDGTGTLVPFFNARNFLLPGAAEITGLELEATWMPFDSTVLTATYSYIDSEYTNYEFNFVEQIAGFSQMRGNQTPRQPENSGNLTATQFFSLFESDAYVRAEFFYQGKTFVDESNLAYLDSFSTVNLRAGISTDKYLIEIYGTNVFDEEAWASGGRWTDFSSPFQPAFFVAKQGVAVTPLDKPDFGLRAVWRFGER